MLLYHVFINFVRKSIMLKKYAYNLNKRCPKDKKCVIIFCRHAGKEWAIPLFNVVRRLWMENKIRELLEEDINEAGYILDEVFYGKEEGVNTLRLVIDKQGYININDCVKVNDIVNPILDKEDPISESYVLDVCSKEKGSDIDG